MMSDITQAGLSLEMRVAPVGAGARVSFSLQNSTGVDIAIARPSTQRLAAWVDVVGDVVHLRKEILTPPPFIQFDEWPAPFVDLIKSGQVHREDLLLADGMSTTNPTRPGELVAHPGALPRVDEKAALVTHVRLTIAVVQVLRPEDVQAFPPPYGPYIHHWFTERSPLLIARVAELPAPLRVHDFELSWFP